MEKENILIVDDEKNIQFVITKCLEDAGYGVVTASDGESALTKIGKESFSIVILDIKMPGMDGLQVLQRIKALVPEQRVIMITAHGTIDTAVEAMKLGAMDYLQKPFTPEDLRAAVKHNISKTATVWVERADTFGSCIARGRRFLEQKQLDQALLIIRKAITIESERPEPFNLLGVLAELRGDLKAANRMYRVALALNNSYQPAILNLHRISQWKYDSFNINFGDVPEEKVPLIL
ncbi:MAG: response regulator [Negativicutes bacterium]